LAARARAAQLVAGRFHFEPQQLRGAFERNRGFDGVEVDVGQLSLLCENDSSNRTMARFRARSAPEEACYIWARMLKCGRAMAAGSRRPPALQ
jgi:hypothetical protein